MESCAHQHANGYSWPTTEALLAPGSCGDSGTNRTRGRAELDPEPPVAVPQRFVAERPREVYLSAAKLGSLAHQQ
jgi:hypothetical protein